MFYLYSDFLFLRFAAEKGSRTVSDVCRRSTEASGHAWTAPALTHAVDTLTRGGYITVGAADGSLLPTAAVTVTDSGRALVRIGGLKKLLRRTESAFAAHEQAFLKLTVPASTGEGIPAPDPEAFAGLFRPACCDLIRGHINDGRSVLSLSAYEAADSIEDEAGDTDPDTAAYNDTLTVTEAADRACAVAELLHTVTVLLTESPRIRKCCLPGLEAAYIVTFAPIRGEGGTNVRVTAAPIRFNRQRFRGKRDGDLDYAQCADNVMDFTTTPDRLGDAIRWGAVNEPALVTETMRTDLLHLSQALS